MQGPDGPVLGVVGRKPLHLLDADQRKKVVEMKSLHIDIGAADGEAAAQLVRVGDPVVVASEPLGLVGDRIVSRSMDNRLGAYVALEALRRCHEQGALKSSFAAIAAVLTSFVTESPLTGIGAGGYMLVHTGEAGDEPVVLDFFVAAPGADGLERGESGRQRVRDVERRGLGLDHGEAVADVAQHVGEPHPRARQMLASSSEEASFWPRSTSER